MDIWEWLGLVCVLLISLYVYYTWNFGYWESQGVPGPRPWPVIGTVNWARKHYNFLDDLKRVKKYGRVYGVYEGRQPALVVVDAEILKQVLIKDYPSFSDNKLIPGIEFQPIARKFLGALNGSEWKRVHHLMSPSFTAANIRTMMNIFDEKIKILEKILGEVADSGKSVEVKRLFDSLTLDIISAAAFGCDANCQEGAVDHPLIANATNILKLFATWKVVLTIFFPILGPLLKPDVFPKENIDYIATALNDVIERRRNKTEHRNDLIQRLVNSEDDDLAKEGQKTALTNEEVIAQAVLILFAGYETTSGTLVGFCYYLAKNPDVQEKLAKEMNDILKENDGELASEAVLNNQYLDMVISEVLRVKPPGNRFQKCATRDCKLGDIEVKKGTEIIMPMYALHYDQEYYPQPERFDPERFSAENKASRHALSFIPFGHGPRICIGKRFALTEIKMTAARVINRFRISTCTETQPLILREIMKLLVPKNDVYLTFQRRAK